MEGFRLVGLFSQNFERLVEWVSEGLGLVRDDDDE